MKRGIISMARMLKYPANCFYCKRLCDPKKEKPNEKSYLHRANGKNYAHCYACYKSKKEKTLWDSTIYQAASSPLSQETIDKMIEKVKDNSLKDKDWSKNK